jgi:hypothetical protein
MPDRPEELSGIARQVRKRNTPKILANGWKSPLIAAETHAYQF